MTVDVGVLGVEDLLDTCGDHPLRKDVNNVTVLGAAVPPGVAVDQHLLGVLLQSVPCVCDEILCLFLGGGSEGPACTAGALIDDRVDGAETETVGRSISPVIFCVGLTEAKVIAGARTTFVGTNAIALLRVNLGKTLLWCSRGGQQQERLIFFPAPVRELVVDNYERVGIVLVDLLIMRINIEPDVEAPGVLGAIGIVLVEPRLPLTEALEVALLFRAELDSSRVGGEGSEGNDRSHQFAFIIRFNRLGRLIRGEPKI